MQTVQDIKSLKHSGPFETPFSPSPLKVVHGNPLQQMVNSYSSPCGQFNSGVWQSLPGKWKVSYSEHEFCHIIEGAAIIRDTEGNEMRVNEGDSFTIPAGFEGTWEVLKPCRKIYVTFEAE